MLLTKKTKNQKKNILQLKSIIKILNNLKILTKTFSILIEFIYIMKLSDLEKQVVNIIHNHNFSPQMKKKWFAEEISKIIFKQDNKEKNEFGKYDSDNTLMIWTLLKKLESKNLIKFIPVFCKKKNRYRECFELALTNHENTQPRSDSLTSGGNARI